jgi:hypothetical protein
MPCMIDFPKLTAFPHWIARGEKPTEKKVNPIFSMIAMWQSDLRVLAM